MRLSKCQIRHLHKLQNFLFSFLLLLLATWTTRAQTNQCTLDIGGQEPQTLIGVFQLNEDQQDRLEEWRAELIVQRRAIEDDIRQLLDTHPQSSEDDLVNMANKYAVLQDQLLDLIIEYDQKLLGTLNEKQYAFYVELCEEALRRPLVPVAVVRENEEPE